MKCELCKHNETNGTLLCQACTALIHPPFDRAYPTPGTELARALAAELAPYLYAD
jgi:hypothetical protein